jgi:hypothetical protein
MFEVDRRFEIVGKAREIYCDESLSNPTSKSIMSIAKGRTLVEVYSILVKMEVVVKVS